MRYRALSVPDRDYTFGQAQANFLVNSPAAVAQSVLTRLLLFTGEWFLNLAEGMPWSISVLGKGTKALYDQAIQQRVLATQNVLSIDAYASSLDDTTRSLSVEMTITTSFGQVNVQVIL